MKVLKGKVCLVTGAGSGIGRALVLAFAGQGMRVAAADINAEAAEAVADEARALGVPALGLRCDVSEDDAMKVAVDRVAAELGSVSLFCANAGVTAFERFADMAPEDIDWLYAVNFLGLSRGVRAVLPGMIAAGEGHIVATASMAGLVPTWVPIHVPYTATKGGILGLMMNLRSEAADVGIGCTTLCPGGVATDILNSPRRRPAQFGGPKDTSLVSPPGFKAPAQAKYARRTPEEVAGMVVNAVLNDYPLVVTDAGMKQLYKDYADMVLEAFDIADVWERANGLEQAVT